MADATPLPIGSEVGARHRFRLERWLGGGAFGGVYEATTLDETAAIPAKVAIKLISGELSDKARRHTLQRELSSLLAIDSPRIPKVFDGAVDGTPFIAMEYFQHGTLADLQSRVGPLDATEALALFQNLLEALAAAHDASVLHLDVKPENVLLDGNGGFVLADFGISQASRLADLPMQGLGSQGWQAPEQEQRLRDAFDTRTDLYGAGAVLWSALTGVDLASRQADLLRKRAERSAFTLPPVVFVRKTPIDAALDEIVTGLLARDPNARPGSAREVLAKVLALRAGKGVVEWVEAGTPITPEEAAQLVESVLDPLVARMFRTDLRGIRRLRAGELLCRQGDGSQHAWVLLKGVIRVVRDGAELARAEREGEFLGEIAAFTGEVRSATLMAVGESYVRVLDAAQLESVVASNPALAVRLIRSMANRFRQLEGRK